MKKTWIRLKRGILKPEHREKLGIRVWLFMHMIDIADWDTGMIEGWTDREAADELGMPLRTVQDQRQQLASDLYIDCRAAFQSQTIVIRKWVNPRRYDGVEQNTGTESSVGGTESSVPIQSESSVPFLIDHVLTMYDVELPEELMREDFVSAWFEWEEWRKKEKRKKLTPTAVKKQMGMLAQYADQAKDIIDWSIMSDYQGLFPPKGNNRSRGPNQTAGRGGLPEGA